MGAALTYGDVGVWASNGERDLLLDWFAEHRCARTDSQWKYCNSPGNRWTGCGIDLTELIPRGEVFELSADERTAAAAHPYPNFIVLLEIIAAMTRGEWTHALSSKEAVQWRSRTGA